MLFRHLGDTHVGTDHEQAVVWEERCHTVDRCLQVFLVAAHVKQMNDFLRVRDDVWPDFVLLLGMGHFRDVLISIGLESHDFVRNRRCPSILLFVLEIENLLSHHTSAVIELARSRCQHS